VLLLLFRLKQMDLVLKGEIAQAEMVTDQILALLNFETVLANRGERTGD
jgi:hypothetical protein